MSLGPDADLRVWLFFVCVSCYFGEALHQSNNSPVASLLEICFPFAGMSTKGVTGSLFCLQNFKTWIYDVINSFHSSTERINDDVNIGLFSCTFY